MCEGTVNRASWLHRLSGGRDKGAHQSQVSEFTSEPARAVPFLQLAVSSAPPSRPLRYAFRKVSRSALMVSASVVGMPCGKPL